MKLKTIINADEALAKLSTQPLQGTKLFEIEDLFEKLIPKIDNFKKQRFKLFEKYGVKDENGNYMIKPENEEKYREEMQDLLDFEINEDFPKIKIILDDTIKISYVDKILLKDFIDFVRHE